ncbi:hypothetical protein HYDPIDRAFT_115217, partial [Hydnomerulius pinastri MD-312]
MSWPEPCNNCVVTCYDQDESSCSCHPPQLDLPQNISAIYPFPFILLSYFVLQCEKDVYRTQVRS